MSRVGNKVINIPAGVTATVENNTIVVKGPKGELTYTFNADIKVEVVGAEIKVTRPSEEKAHRALHGTTRANIQNMVTGVSEGYEKVLEIIN